MNYTNQLGSIIVTICKDSYHHMDHHNTSRIGVWNPGWVVKDIGSPLGFTTVGSREPEKTGQ